jgi:hypothetical protein
MRQASCASPVSLRARRGRLARPGN